MGTLTTSHLAPRARKGDAALLVGTPLLSTAPLGGCAPFRPSEPSEGDLAPPRHAKGEVLGGDDRFPIYVPTEGDTLASAARDFLGSERRAWSIAEFNGTARLQAGSPVVVTAAPRPTPRACFRTATRPSFVLCYHRFSSNANKMSVSPSVFAAQLDYLARNGYRVLRLDELADFLEGRQALPQKAVAITIDDGYASTYQHAFPLPRSTASRRPSSLHGFPRRQGRRDLAPAPGDGRLRPDRCPAPLQDPCQPQPAASGESDERYRERLDTEIRLPRDMLEDRLPIQVSSYAYPYGDANERGRREDRPHQLPHCSDGRSGRKSGLLSHPLLLRRTMIFGDHDIEAFKAKLQVFREMDLR
ncbi:MAG: hypothetical protein MZV70_62665 [Desulfobacterales bacterium]|nr:hypothetical protein [Desulfobacterales bacterium]